MREHKCFVLIGPFAVMLMVAKCIVTVLMGALMMCWSTCTVAAEAPREAWEKLSQQAKIIAGEAARAEAEGYVAHYAIAELRQCEEDLRKANIALSDGSRAGEAGQLVDSAREHLRRAKGFLVNLKLPEWSKEFRFARKQEVEQNKFPLRGIFFWGRGFALSGFRRWAWWAGNCRPHADAAKVIDEWHQKGQRILLYLEGTLVPQSYVLLPNGEEWVNGVSREYGHRYTHYGERWWGMSGAFSGWREWMTDKMKFAARLGFDGMELDSAFGPYYEATAALEANPLFVMCPNDYGRVYIDGGERPRYGVPAMCEGSGVPYRGSWDQWHKRLRRIAWQAYNVPIWGYLYDDAEGFVSDLAFATELADKITDVCMQEGNAPSPQYLIFSRRFADYLYGSYVDVYGPTDAVKFDEPMLRCLVNQRRLMSGRGEWVLHFINTDVGKKDVQEKRSISVEVSLKGYDGRQPPVVTLLSPEGGATSLAVKRDGDRLTFTLPVVRIWDIVVIGEPLFAKVQLVLVKRGGAEVKNPLDNEVVAGEPFEVKATVEELITPQPIWKLEVRVPEGWRSERISGEGREQHFRITPAHSARAGAGYAITPIVRQGGEAMPSFPLQVKVAPKLSLRFSPPCVDSPARKPTTITLAVKNNGKSGTAHVHLRAPDGWKLEPETFTSKIVAGDTVHFPVQVMPKDYGLKFWDFLDEDVQAEWQVGSARGEMRLSVRVFPVQFEVYSRGTFPLILHGYPNIIIKSSSAETDFALFEKPLPETIDAAFSSLRDGNYVVIWLAEQELSDELRTRLGEFIRAGGGVVWHGKPFGGDYCPVDGEGAQLSSTSITLLPSPFTDPVLRFKASFSGNFTAEKVKVKGWAKVIATWQDGSPAIVVSQDAKKRVVWIGSELGMKEAQEFHRNLRSKGVELTPKQMSEMSPNYDLAGRKENLWYLTYLYYNLLSWAAGSDNSNG